MFFKNAMIYKLTRKVIFNAMCEQDFAAFEYIPCKQNEMKRMGFTYPIIGQQNLVHISENDVLIAVMFEEKNIPTQTISLELQKRVDKLEEQEKRPISRNEKQQLKVDVIAQLLPRAFSKFKRVSVWIDNDNQRIVIDTASYKTADDVMSLIRKAFGSLPAIPLPMKNPPEITMTEWVDVPEEISPFFTILEDIKLQSALEKGGRISAKDLDTKGDEIKAALVNDKLVVSLGLKFGDELKFKLDDSMTLKGMKFSDQVLEQSDDAETMITKCQADFFIMTSVMRRMLKDLIRLAGGEKTRDDQ